MAFEVVRPHPGVPEVAGAYGILDAILPSVTTGDFASDPLRALGVATSADPPWVIVTEPVRPSPRPVAVVVSWGEFVRLARLAHAAETGEG